MDGGRPAFKKRRFLDRAPTSDASSGTSSEPTEPKKTGRTPPPEDAPEKDKRKHFSKAVREITGELDLDQGVLDILYNTTKGNVPEALNSWYDGFKKVIDAMRPPGSTILPAPVCYEDHPSPPQRPVRSLQRIPSATRKPTVMDTATNNEVPLKRQASSESSASSTPVLATAHAPASRADTPRTAASKPAPARPSANSNWTRKYIGAFGTQGYLTNSFAKLTAGQRLLITRQNMEAKVAASRGGKAGGASSKSTLPYRTFQSAKDSKKPPSYLTRFCLPNGTEVGRLPQDSAIVVATLIDQDMCTFEAECIFAPDRVRVGANVDLQVKCYLKRSAFQHKSTPSTNNELVDDSAESAEEKVLKLRRYSLVKLFELVNLQAVPKTGDVATAAVKSAWSNVATMAEDAIDQKPVSEKPKSSSDDDEETEDGTELQQDQLDSLYRKAQTYDINMPMMEPADTFAFTLKPYQKQALHWMYHKEQVESEGGRQSDSMHPLWEQFNLPFEDGVNPSQADIADATFYMNPYSGEMSLQFPKALDQCLGGVLADEMGLGKTIEILSLVHTSRMKREATDGETNGAGFMSHQKNGSTNACHTTLVVAPLSLIQQWQSEAESASNEGTLKTLLYYGNDKALDLKQLCSGPNAHLAPDLIITSYGVVLSEWSNWQSSGKAHGSGLFSVDFYRVVLDEAHTIKNRQAKTSRACFNLSATRRWALTGTPIVNKLEDLFSLVHYLGVEPWGHFSFWRTFITIPFESKEYIRALDVVQTVLEPLVLRRTKDMKDNEGLPIVQLPEKVVEKVYLELTERERAIYDLISARARRTFKINAAQGTVMKNYSFILSMLLRLRQSCCDPSLVKQSATAAELSLGPLEDAGPDGAANDEEAADEALLEDVNLREMLAKYAESANQDSSGETDGEESSRPASAYGIAVMQQIVQDSEQECPICAEEPLINHTVTKCFHAACKDCLVGHIAFQRNKGDQPLCHICREPVDEKDLLEVIRERVDSDANAEEQILLRPVMSSAASAAHRGGVSTKVAALLDHLDRSRRADGTTKSVVFSQFTGFLDIVQTALERRKLPIQRLDGSMAMRERTCQIDAFRSTTSPGAVLLISLKAGGVGLNLTAANHVYVLDPWWSSAVESQAVDRIHRMGQSRDVKVFRFLIKESVEEKMLKVQDRKNFLAGALGMTKEERRHETLRDIETLFED
ncbi:DNA helicase rad5 [Savitreella phatthalungensis]